MHIFSQMISAFKKVKILSLFLFLGSISIHAYSEGMQEDSALKGIRGLGRQFYVTGLWHDGGRKASFFLLKDLDKGRCLWWDTGMVLSGTHFGYRKILAASWFDQQWFGGVYGGFDVMSDFLPSIFSPSWMSFALFPTRLNLGFELSGAKWGQTTLNFYGEPYNPSQNPIAKDYIGISSKISFNHFPFSIFPNIKPFLGFSFSGVGLASNEFKIECLPSFIMGAKWVVNTWLDLELKYIYDHKGYQKPLNFGFQIKFDGVDLANNYFKHRYHRPPDCYIPHYAHSSKLVAVRTKEQQPEKHVNELARIEQSIGSDVFVGDTSIEEIERVEHPCEQQKKNDRNLKISRVFREQFRAEVNRAEDLYKKYEEAHPNQQINWNTVQKNVGGNDIVIQGGVPQEELHGLLDSFTSGEFLTTPIIEYSERQHTKEIALYGTTASFLYGVQRTVMEIINTAHDLIAKEFSYIKVTNKEGTQETYFLCSKTSLENEKNARVINTTNTPSALEDSRTVDAPSIEDNALREHSFVVDEKLSNEDNSSSE